MTFAYAQPEKESFVLVEFKYGDPSSPSYARYTDWNEDYLSLYSATPTMTVKLPENGGTFEERTLEIEMTLDAFNDPLSNGSPHSPVFVTVREITRALTGGPQATDLIAFKGRVVRTIRNYQGRSNRVLIKALPIKSRIDFPLALNIGHHCPWTVFGRGCGLNPVSFRVNGVIDAIDGKEITTSTVAVTGQADKYWHRGYLEFGGLKISIQNWSSSDPTHVYLTSQPPDSWLGATVVFLPGCDKTIETCRSRFLNEEHFGAIGHAIPPYNPLMESP